MRSVTGQWPARSAADHSAQEEEDDDDDEEEYVTNEVSCPARSASDDHPSNTGHIKALSDHLKYIYHAH